MIIKIILGRLIFSKAEERVFNISSASSYLKLDTAALPLQDVLLTLLLYLKQGCKNKNSEGVFKQQQ